MAAVAIALVPLATTAACRSVDDPPTPTIAYRLPSPSASSQPLLDLTRSVPNTHPSPPPGLLDGPSPTPSPTPTPAPVAPPRDTSVRSASVPPALPTTRAVGDTSARAGAAHAVLSGHELEPYAEMLIQVADEYAIDYRLLVAISIWESTGGDAACGFNAWGYRSCAVTFSSWEEGARTCADLLVRLGAREDYAYALRVWVAGGGGANTEHAWAYMSRVQGTMERMP